MNLEQFLKELEILNNNLDITLTLNEYDKNESFERLENIFLNICKNDKDLSIEELCKCIKNSELGRYYFVKVDKDNVNSIKLILMSLQKTFVEWGRVNGIDSSIFDTSIYEQAFNYSQTRVLYDMLMAGLEQDKVKKIANPHFSSMIMHEIKYYMEFGIDVTPYIYPNFSDKAVREIGEAMMDGITPSYSHQNITVDELFEFRMNELEKKRSFLKVKG